MKFDDILLNKMEHKMLICLQYHHANLWELHGYFDFPGIEPILISLQTLLDNNLIYKAAIQETEDYHITPDGEKYLTYSARKKRARFRKCLGGIIATLASIVAIAEFVLPALTSSPL